MLKLISGQFTIPKDNALSIAETLMDEENETRTVFAFVIEGKEKNNAFKKIKEIFQENIFDNEKDLLLRFEESMKKTNQELKEFEDIKISGVIAVQERNELHVSQAGQGEAYLIRRNKLNVIIENTLSEKEGESERENKDEDIFTSIASGELSVDDQIVFSSLRVLRYATASQLVLVLSEGISEGLSAVKDLLEIEAGEGAVMCFHAKGSSVFSNAESSIRVSRKLRFTFFSQAVDFFDKTVENISQKTGKSYDLVRNSLLGGLAFIFFVILVVAVSSASIDNLEKEKHEIYKIQMLKTEKELQAAETRALMNDLESSNAILDKIEGSIQKMLTEGVFVDEGLAILERIQNQRDSANKVTRIKNMGDRMLADISVVAPGESVQGIISLNGGMYAYTKKSLFKSVLDHVDPKITITEKDEIIRAHVIEDQNAIIFTLSSGTLMEYIDGQVKAATTADEGGFKKAISERGYSRFLYSLSPEDNQIWRYERKREGFTAPSAWLEGGESIANAIDLAIDGSVYVLKKEGGVSLFHKGKEIALSIKGGSANALSAATKIFVKTDMLNIYFLNPERNSIVVFEIINKGLSYKKEYIFETATPINDFYVDQNEQRMVVSDENKMYEITL